MRILLWYRNDLRLHDHELLYRACQQGCSILPLYCFDPRHFGQTAFGFPKTGAYRAQFLLESVADLRQAWTSLGGDLIVRQGPPEAVIPELAQQLGIDAVYWHAEATAEERAVEQALSDSLQQLGIAVEQAWAATLYLPNDLPFGIDQVPEVFTQFRKQVERHSAIRPPRPAPKRVDVISGVDPGVVPSLPALGLQKPIHDPRAVWRFVGGESAARQRLQHYLWDGDHLQRYKDTRNGMLGPDYSSKFSPWLALGCLSPRYISQEVQRYEASRIRNDSTYWLIFELLWRDYFRFICAKHGNTVFYPSGLRGLPIAWKQDRERFDLWCQGNTGYPLVDASMRELAATGFMSNRGRQNVASFLTKNLGIDWRLGAEWFESLLIDHDVCSNYGNWNYTAGVGNDARGFRYFNIPKQAKDYDPNGDYVKHWLPELASLPAAKVHTPWQLQPVEQTRFGVRLGVDYPHPVVDLDKSVRANEAIYNRAVAQEDARRVTRRRG